MKSITITAFIIMLLILGILQSCGVRKSNVDILKQSESTKEGGKDKGEDKKESESKSESKEETKVDKSEEVVTTKVEEEIDSNGKVNKRTTTTSKEKRTDNSQMNKSSSDQSKTFEYKSWVKTYYKVITIRTKEKSKDVEVDNRGWVIVVGLLGAIALLFGFMYVKARRAITHRESMF